MRSRLTLSCEMPMAATRPSSALGSFAPVSSSSLPCTQSSRRMSTPDTSAVIMLHKPSVRRLVPCSSMLNIWGKPSQRVF
jgi:hypothetical protein